MAKLRGDTYKSGLRKEGADFLVKVRPLNKQIRSCKGMRRAFACSTFFAMAAHIELSASMARKFMKDQ
eukprot:CAMPEP_0115192536 /NCGR_PEP_ID=MMETSP0270-20121206/13092_1 /TAXON_ID=71861 /ORGANISM="Scrippsiella trochoidea, Strain CCMP3099" /LENGTH=67 /DNA_ID=CAMNT_0002605783 /DNA_START=332 /DNA_END=535 /DNA_ORIENTATION=-